MSDTRYEIHFIHTALKQMHSYLCKIAARNDLDDPGEQRSLEDACRELHEAIKSLDVLP